jgi:uncharacterized protein
MNFNLVVTSKCNLGCKYCYEGEEKKGIDMNKFIADKSIGFIYEKLNSSEDNKVKKHKIIFHGGEPLLNIKVIKYIKEKIDLTIGKEYIIQYEMTSNGTIFNKDIKDFIQNNDINLSISIDGIEEVHDRNRKFKNGKGSFDIAVTNLKKFLNITGVRVRMTISSDNANYLHEGIKLLSDIGVKTIVPIQNFYDSNWTDENISNLNHNIEKLIDEFYKDENIVISTIDEESLLSSRGDCFGGISTFTIGETGDVYPCLFCLNNDDFIIGNIVNNDIKHIDKNARNLLFERYKSNNCECDTCDGKEFCDGNRCKLLNYMVNKDYNTPPLINCIMTKVNIDTYYKLNSINLGEELC